MKNQTLHIPSLFLLVGLAVAPAYAQTGGTKVNVPFKFVVAGKTFSAGQYVVLPERDNIRIRNSDGRTVAIVTTDAQSGTVPHRNGRVVFNCYGEQCFLSQVWVLGQDTGRRLPKSKLEIERAQRQTEQQFAVLGTKSQR